MKILDYMPPVSARYPIAGNRMKVEPSRDEKNFDKITLQRNHLSPEQSFTMETIARVTQDVRTATTTGDIQSLQERVAAGQYQIDVDAIARRMLLE